MVERGCTSQGSEAGKVFLPPSILKLFLGKSLDRLVLEALPTSLVSPVARGILLPEFAVLHVPLPGTCFFLPSSFVFILVKCFAWSGQSVTNFLPQVRLLSFFLFFFFSTEMNSPPDILFC